MIEDGMALWWCSILVMGVPDKDLYLGDSCWTS